MRELRTAEGSLVLTEAALAGVASAAAARCGGVVATAPRRLQDELARLLSGPGAEMRSRGEGRAGRPPARREAAPAEVDLDAEHCRVWLDVVVAYGARITDVCREVAAAVSDDLFAAVGFRPDHVEVRVVGVRAGEGRAGRPGALTAPGALPAPLPVPAPFPDAAAPAAPGGDLGLEGGR